MYRGARSLAKRNTRHPPAPLFRRPLLLLRQVVPKSRGLSIGLGKVLEAHHLAGFRLFLGFALTAAQEFFAWFHAILLTKRICSARALVL
jgi:hypothetical protein